MSNYTGVRCPACSKRFTASDDVVVCPVCGAPHHRVCYAEKGECVFAGEHLNGVEWQAPQEQQSAVSACPACGAGNPADAVFCQVCGGHMAGGQAQEGSGDQVFQTWVFPNYDGQFDPNVFVYGGVSPDDEIGGQKVRDIAVYVGSNTAYFLPRFKRLSEGAHPVSVNVPAVVFNVFYYFYRKMYWIGAVMLGLWVVAKIPQFLAMREMMPELIQQPAYAFLRDMMIRMDVPFSVFGTEVNHDAAAFYQRINTIANSCYYVLQVGVALMANALYYRKVLNNVSRIHSHAGGQGMAMSQYHSTLAYSGGVSGMMVFCAGAVMMLAMFVVGYIMA